MSSNSGGGGSGFGGSAFEKNYHPESINPDQLNAFLQSDYGQSPVAKRMAGVKDVYKTGDGKVFTADLKNDITDVYGQYAAYLAAANKDSQARADYLKAFADMPGRAATILGGGVNPSTDPGKVLGAMLDPTKNTRVLGG
jgi:hypothetical protein